MRITLGVINLLLALIFSCIVLSLGFGVEIISKETLASILDVKGFSKDIAGAHVGAIGTILFVVAVISIPFVLSILKDKNISETNY